MSLDEEDRITLNDLIERVSKLEEGKSDREHVHENLVNEIARLEAEKAPIEHEHTQYAEHSEIPVVTVPDDYATKEDIEQIEDLVFEYVDALDRDMEDLIPDEHTEVETPPEPIEEKRERLRMFF